ncbi:MAG: ankyrin repeat domain-containing protein [Planctomycetaceae bacterium]
MDARNYSEWAELSGLYVRNLSHLDRYQTFRSLISPAGLNTLIVAEFLQDNRDGINPVNWRTHSIYEFGGQQQDRIELTANALEAVGATRTAAAIRSARSVNPFDVFQLGEVRGTDDLLDRLSNLNGSDLINHMRNNLIQNFPELASTHGWNRSASESEAASASSSDHESREEISQQLERYVAANLLDLQQDLKRHGDPRTVAGYSRQKRLQELDAMRAHQTDLAVQIDEAAKIHDYVNEIQKKLKKAAQSGTVPNVNSTRRKLLKLTKAYKRRPMSEVGPEMQAAISRTNSLLAEHPELIAVDPIGDAAINERLTDIGEYEFQSLSGQTFITWEDPVLIYDWAKLSLRLQFPSKQLDCLQGLLSAVDRLKQQLKTLVPGWQLHLVESFRNYESQIDGFELEDYERDLSGEVTVESILQHVSSGHIALQSPGDCVVCRVFFSFDWDEEHGLEILWDEEPPVPPSITRNELPGRIQWTDAGRKLTSDELIQLEQRFQLVLPPEYRCFLLDINGGKPAPNHLVTKSSGMLVPIDVERLFSVAGTESGSNPESLEAQIESARAESVPSFLLPIGRLTTCDPTGRPAPSTLMLVTEGKKAGQLFSMDFKSVLGSFSRAMSGEVLKMMADSILEMGIPTARSVNKFLDGLTIRPDADLPEWLLAIRDNNFERLKKWFDAGGKLSQTHQEYGAHIPLTVVDYLTMDATTDLLKTVLAERLLKPRQLKESWERYQLMNIARFRELMNVLPNSIWPAVMKSPEVWQHPDVWERLAEAGINFNAPLNEDGAPPIHLAVQSGSREAVKWLMKHGADPHQADKYRRTAFIWAEHGLGFSCLPILEGRDEIPPPAGEPSPDAAGIAILKAAADQLPPDLDIMITIEVRTVAVTRVEKAYGEDCHYRLTFYVRRPQVTFNDMRTPRQDYLRCAEWPTYLFAPILQWPDLKPIWETLEVTEFDIQKAIKKRTYQPSPRNDLAEAAHSALEQGFDAYEAAVRGIELVK